MVFLYGYDGFITFVTSCIDPCIVEDTKSLLLAQEEHFEKHRALDNTLPQEKSCFVYLVVKLVSKNCHTQQRTTK